MLERIIIHPGLCFSFISVFSITYTHTHPPPHLPRPAPHHSLHLHSFLTSLLIESCVVKPSRPTPSSPFHGFDQRVCICEWCAWCTSSSHSCPSPSMERSYITPPSPAQHNGMSRGRLTKRGIKERKSKVEGDKEISNAATAGWLQVAGGIPVFSFFSPFLIRIASLCSHLKCFHFKITTPINYVLCLLFITLPFLKSEKPHAVMNVPF